MNLIKSTITVFASLVFSLLIVETILRVTGSIPPLKYQKQIFQEHEDLGWIFKPGSHALYDPFQRVVSIDIGSNGFRNTSNDHSITANHHNKKVLIIGDSVTAGIQVSSGETFSDRITNSKNGLFALNYGVNGYSTDQALIVLEEHLDRVQPDLVIYSFVLNDPEGNGTDRIRIDDKTYGKPSFDKDLNFKPKPFSVIFTASPITLKVKDFLRLHSRIYNLLSITKNSFQNAKLENEALARKMCAPFTLNRFSNSDVYKDQWDLTKKLILRMKELSKGIGSEFILFNTPHPVFADKNVRGVVSDCFDTIDQSIDSVSNRFASFASKWDVDIIDFLPAEADKFADVNDCKLVFALDDGRILDGHLTECGHRFAAKVIEKGVQELYGW
jgi:hypothetical protein